MSPANLAYKPAAGSTESRVVELLRFLPCGTALHGGDLDARLQLGERRGLASILRRSVVHGLLMAEKRADAAGHLRTYWMDVRPFPEPEGQQ